LIPAAFGQPATAGAVFPTVPGMITVGNVNNDGTVYSTSDTASWLVLYAPGVNVNLPYWVSGLQQFYTKSGTSACM